MIATVETSESFTRFRSERPAKRKILLVDNDPAMRLVLSRLLAGESFLVLTAATSVEALELVKLTRFDLVLLDLKTPTERDWETFARLSEQNPLLPVIVITDRQDQLFHALATGVGALLEKPLNFTKLFHTINYLLEEPTEARLARFAGQPVTFHHIQPIKGGLQKVSRAN